MNINHKVRHEQYYYQIKAKPVRKLNKRPLCGARPRAGGGNALPSLSDVRRARCGHVHGSCMPVWCADRWQVDVSDHIVVWQIQKGVN